MLEQNEAARIAWALDEWNTRGYDRNYDMADEETEDGDNLAQQNFKGNHMHQ